MVKDSKLNEYIDIFDEKDKVVDIIKRQEIYSPNITHRAVFVLVVNPNGEIFVGKRTKDRMHYPNRFQSVGGIVQSRQSYTESAISELEEELKIQGNLINLGVVKQRTKVDNSNIGVFVCEYDGSISLNRDEFLDYQYLPYEDLLDAIENRTNEYTPGTIISLIKYFKYLKTYKVSAPGKVFISGEWSVLRPGNSCVVAAVDKKVNVIVKKSKDESIDLSIKDFNINNLKAKFVKNRLQFNQKLNKDERQYTLYLQNSIETVGKYLGGVEPFEMITEGESTNIKINGKVKKLGFGSSASSTVGVIAALMRYHGYQLDKDISREEIYKLAAIANYFAQNKVGSGFDIASSTYGGLIQYKRFDPDWLSSQLLLNKSVKEIVNQNWTGFNVASLSLPKNFNLLVGWTNKSASTSEMVRDLYKWRDNAQEEFDKQFDRIDSIVKELISALKSNNKEKVLVCLRENHKLLSELGKTSSVNIEIPELKQMAEIANKHGGAGKLAGAGGGDIGIAVSFDKDISSRIVEDWEKHGIKYVDTKISRNGVKTLY